MDDDDRHKREQQDLRAKRKAAKISKSDSQLEKDRKRKEHRQKILKQQGAVPGSAGKLPDAAQATSSAFQKLLEQRAQGFQIDFRFRNAPPRPPVGPCFVGQTIDAVLQENSRQYKSLNAVEANHRWKLHSEADLGVPLAPSAMDNKSYSAAPDENEQLDPADAELLDWKGSMGDTAADELKLRQDQARAAARAVLTGRPIPKAVSSTAASQRPTSKKAFSRVLNEGMQTWMKRTTYLSNDPSRKVHDFKSLAQTKQELVADLQQKQDELAKHRSVRSIVQSFELSDSRILHPSRQNLKPKSVCQVLPNVEHWGKAYTHVVIDKKPAARNYETKSLDQAMVANVEKPQPNARMTCQLLVPKEDEHYQAVSSYDLDVVPLKEEDAPHAHFCLWVDPNKSVATYIPISSRVQLSAGRPAKSTNLRPVGRRDITDQEKSEQEERMAEVDQDMAEKHHIATETPLDESNEPVAPAKTTIAAGDEAKKDLDGDGEDDFGDDDDDSDSEDEKLFGSGARTIVAES